MSSALVATLGKLTATLSCLLRFVSYYFITINFSSHRMFPPFVMAMFNTIAKQIAPVKMYYKYLSKKENDAEKRRFQKVLLC